MEQGSRKQKAFYLTSALLHVAFLAALFAGATADSAFIAYTGAQSLTVAGFFGANYGEHKQKANVEAAKNGKPQS